MNSVGSYKCSCNPGYELSNDNITCNVRSVPSRNDNRLLKIILLISGHFEKFVYLQLLNEING